MTVLEWVNDKLSKASKRLEGIGWSGAGNERELQAWLEARIEVLLEIKAMLEREATR